MVHCCAVAETSLRELALLFLRLGTTAFGGPAAHIALMRHEVVVRRGWLSEARFLDLLGISSVIPGPTSTELAIHIGWERRGWAGLWVAGLAFIVPAVLITGALAWAYVAYGHVPAVGWALYGVKPVILAVVAQAIVGLAPQAARTPVLRVLGLAALGAALAGLHELLVLGACALMMLALGPRRERPTEPPSGAQPGEPPRGLLPLALGLGATTTAATLVTPTALFLVFVRIGAVLFGSGYVLLAFLRSELVERLGWLTEAQLIDAIAVGQVTPGPVFTTATFIGYVLAGPLGALGATAGIFLPAFVFVALSGPLLAQVQRSARARAALDGINVGSLGLMGAVTLALGRGALVDAPTVALAVGATAALLGTKKVGPTLLIVLGAVVGGVVHQLGWAANGG